MSRHRHGSPPAQVARNATELSRNLSSRNARRRLSRYGLTAEDYAAMFVAQDGRCAICRQVERSEKGASHVSGLVVDHDHKTGKVRGLLCSRCNSALGLFDDNSDFLRRAVIYLFDSPC